MHNGIIHQWVIIYSLVLCLLSQVMCHHNVSYYVQCLVSYGLQVG